jgi:hypothetical protein
MKAPVLFLLALLLFLLACARKNVHPPSQKSPEPYNPDFIDLRAGWRVLVVTPILKSGQFMLPPASLRSTDPHNIAGTDFLGYENDYYVVKGRDRNVRIEFRSAEVVRDGNIRPESVPRLALFRFPPNIHYVRLMHLLRVSDADHNMAILGAEDTQALDDLTGNVKNKPDQSCQQQARSICIWVPQGVAIRPQKRATFDGKTDWVPAS